MSAVKLFQLEFLFFSDLRRSKRIGQMSQRVEQFPKDGRDLSKQSQVRKLESTSSRDGSSSGQDLRARVSPRRNAKGARRRWKPTRIVTNSESESANTRLFRGESRGFETEFPERIPKRIEQRFRIAEVKQFVDRIVSCHVDRTSRLRHSGKFVQQSGICGVNTTIRNQSF